MCEQQVAYNALLRSGAFKRLPKAHQTMFEAQCKDAKKSAMVQMEFNTRLGKVEADIQEIKRDMVTTGVLREELQTFKNELSKEIKNSERYNFITDIVRSWQFWFLVAVFIGALVGRGYLEHLHMYMK